MPAPTRASRELPNADCLGELGITGLTLAQAQLVLAALSLFIAKGRSKSRSRVNVATSLLVAACQTEVARDGRFEPAALPDLPTDGWPQGKTAFAALGIDHELLAEYWRLAKNRADDACLPLEWVLAFAPAALWPAVWQLICWGPREAGVRCEEALIVLARTPIRFATRRRPAEATLAKGTLESRMDGLWGLMQALIDLRGKLADSENPTLNLELLSRWTSKPERIDLDACGAKEARLDTAGPPIAECRERLQRYYREWQQAAPQRRYRKFRRVLLTAILPLYAPREDALRLVDVSDYLPDYLFRDGQRGPALRLYPGKTIDSDQPHILPLPAELARWIEEWIIFTGRHVGQTGQPLWPGNQPKPGKPVKRISVSGFYAAIAGRPGTNGHGSSYALVPRADNPFEGFNPHAYRHTGYQSAKRAGERVKAADPYAFGNVDSEDFARAVCGHDLNQSVSDTYNNLRQAELARAAIEYAWQDLWSGGKRYGLDPQEIVDARHHFDTLTAGVAALDRELRLLHQKQTQLVNRSGALVGDQLHAALIESNRLASEMNLKTTDLTRLTDRQEQARQRLEQALTTDVALPDDLDPAQHQALLAAALNQGAERPVDEGLPLADHYTVSDLTEIFDVKEQTINRWYRHGAPTGQQPWNPDGWIDEGPRKKRLQADALNLDALTEPQRKRSVTVRQRRAALQREPIAAAS